MKTLFFLIMALVTTPLFAQTPPIEPGVSQELAKWRAERYSDVRYKLNLTLEKMSPVLKGTMEVRVNLKSSPPYKGGVDAALGGRGGSPLVLDWRKIKGHEDRSIIANVSINGRVLSPAFSRPNSAAGPPEGGTQNVYHEHNEHLIFRDGVVEGENVIKLDFTSPILTSGSAITRYVDKEDGAEYIYSLFVPSDASTAFPVFDQPDLKARFELNVVGPPNDWKIVSNTPDEHWHIVGGNPWNDYWSFPETKPISTYVFAFAAGPWEKVSMAGAVDKSVPPAVAGGLTPAQFNSGGTKALSSTSAVTKDNVQPPATAGGTDSTAAPETSIYVRKSQAAKFKPHAAEVFRLNREAVKYFEQYFDYKFPFPKYDLVLIPEFPFGGMEHAGATFLREASIIFPQEPTKNDHINRATLIFHEAAHQWFGDTVTMRWFDDLWLKEGFATFTAYKAMEKIMPEMNAWKVFYERIKQGAYQTDSTRGTTAIYQPIANLSAAKSAYGNIVYNKAPAFLRQAEFYLGEDKFQTAVRAFLKKHEFGNAGWEDLVDEFAAVKIDELKASEYHRKEPENWQKIFEESKRNQIREWAQTWVNQKGVRTIKVAPGHNPPLAADDDGSLPSSDFRWLIEVKTLKIFPAGSGFLSRGVETRSIFPKPNDSTPLYVKGRMSRHGPERDSEFFFPNYGDYGYGIFLLDEKSRDYVLKNIQNEKDPFLRTMMWGALWDSVREGELDPRVFVELVVRVLSPGFSRPTTSERPVSRNTAADTQTTRVAKSGPPEGGTQNGGAQNGGTQNEDESTIATLLGRTGTALNYYLSEPGAVATGLPVADGVKRPIATAQGSDRNDLRRQVEDLLIERMQNAPTPGLRITYYRAFLNLAASDKARGVLKEMLKQSVPPAVAGGSTQPGASGGSRAQRQPPATAGGTDLPLKTKDRFDIVTRLLILGDLEAPKLLADLEKTETTDDAKRYAYAARAGIGTAENKAKYWNDFVSNKEISESWIEAAFGPWNSVRHAELTLPYLERALKELPNHKRNRKIFFVNGWLGAFIGGQRSEEALAIVNKFLADNPGLDNDLRLKILENVDLIERAVRIRKNN